MPPENPLPPCPATPNCVRTSRLFASSPEPLFSLACSTLEAIGASDVSADVTTRRAEAVFTVVFFKDDVTLLVEPYEEGAVLHIRSASRVGNHDLGVNRRRVRRFFKALGAPTLE